MPIVPSNVDTSVLRGARILIVDDDDDMRELLAVQLEQLGALPLGARSGSEARAILAKAQDGPAVDVLLIDLCMPGPDGIQTLRELRAAGNLVPAILMTAFAQPRVRAEAFALSIQILDKPFSFETLARTASLLLATK